MPAAQVRSRLYERRHWSIHRLGALLHPLVPAEHQMKVVLGKYYRMRNGDIVGPMQRTPIDSLGGARRQAFPLCAMVGDTVRYWTLDGHWVPHQTNDYDLVSEVRPQTNPELPKPLPHNYDCDRAQVKRRGHAVELWRHRLSNDIGWRDYVSNLIYCEVPGGVYLLEGEWVGDTARFWEKQ